MGTHRTEYKPKPDNSDRKMRRCLTCGDMFESSHVGNRICGKHKGEGSRGPQIERAVFRAEISGRSP